MLPAIMRNLRLAWQNFYRNIWLSLAAMIIIVLMLLSVNVLVCVNALSREAIGYLENKVDITIYLKQEATREQADNLYAYLASLEKTGEVKFIPREEAFAEFSKNYSADATIQESLLEIGENPLGDSLRVKAKKLSDYDIILEAIDKEVYNLMIEQRDFRNYTDIINNLRGVTEKIEKAALSLTVILLVIASLVLFNTIRMTIYTRRQEIGVMKLVGASNWFVSGPFFVESLFYSLIAFIVTIILLIPALQILEPYISQLFPESDFTLANYYLTNWRQIFRWQFVGIIVLSVLSSAIAIRRYLKV